MYRLTSYTFHTRMHVIRLNNKNWSSKIQTEWFIKYCTVFQGLSVLVMNGQLKWLDPNTIQFIINNRYGHGIINKFSKYFVFVCLFVWEKDFERGADVVSTLTINKRKKEGKRVNIQKKKKHCSYCVTHQRVTSVYICYSVLTENKVLAGVDELDAAVLP